MKQSKIKPISDFQDIELIRKTLSDKPRDLLLFDLLTQTGISINRLLPLRINDIKNLGVGDEIPIENKFGQFTVMTEELGETVNRYLEHFRPDQNDWLFKSRKGSKPIDNRSCNRLVKGWLKLLDQNGLKGIQSLTKTWELHYRNQSRNKSANSNNVNNEQVIGPVRYKTLRELTYRQLIAAITSGRIKPGQRIIIESIAAQMNISDTPVREALVRLEARGFLSRTSNKGFTVKLLSREDIEELFQLRIMIETMVAEKACQHCSIKTLQKIEELSQQFEAAGNNFENVIRINREFHFTIYKEAGMRNAMGVIEYLWDRMGPYFFLSYVNGRRSGAGIECHKGIVKGMKNRNPKEVSRWLKEDLTRFSKQLIKEFDQDKKNRQDLNSTM